MFEIRTDYLPAPDNWLEWGAIFTDVSVWRPVVERICRENELAEGLEIESGLPGSSAVFIVDREVVVKVFAPFLVQDFHHEVETYQLIDTRLDPYLPELLLYGVYPDRIDWHFLVMSFLPGQPIGEVRDKIPASDGAAVARELGWYIRRLHETPLEGARVIKNGKGDWFNFLKSRRFACLEELRDKTELPLAVLREIGRLLMTDVFLPPQDFRPSLLNGDFTEDHLLLEKRLGEWRISGLIDWADSLVGATEYEWVALWFGLCGQDVSMFREILKSYNPAIRLDARFRQRMMAYTCIHRFGPEVLSTLLSRPGAPKVTSLVDLQSWLWPPF